MRTQLNSPGERVSARQGYMHSGPQKSLWDAILWVQGVQRPFFTCAVKVITIRRDSEYSCFTIIFSPGGEQLNNVYWLISRTTNCRLYSNISQKLLLYKVWGYCDKFDFMKSLGVYYWYVKMPRCGCVEHGLENIMFYVKKYIQRPFLCPRWFARGR